MQWSVYVLGILFLLLSLTAHGLQYYAARPASAGECWGMFLTLALGALLFIVASVTNKTIGKLSEPVLFVLGLIFAIGSLAAPLTAVYAFNARVSDGVVAATAFYGLLGLLFTVLTTIGWDTLGGTTPAPAPEPLQETPADPNSDITPGNSKSNFS